MPDDAKNTVQLDELTIDEAELLDEILGEFGESRRRFIGQSTTVALSTLVLEFIAKRNALAVTPEGFVQTATDENAVTVALRVNGAQKNLTVDSRMTLLDALRERLALT